MTSRAEVFRLLEAVVSGGVLHFDTARSYGKGFSEKLLGEFLRAHKVGVAVTTKFGASYFKTSACPAAVALPLNRMLGSLMRIVGRNRKWKMGERGAEGLEIKDSGFRNAPNLKSQNRNPYSVLIEKSVVERSVEESMKQLGRTRLEILLMHEAVPSQLTGKARQYLAGLQKSGVVGRLGCGTNRWVLEERFQEDPLVEVLQYEGSATEELPLMERFSGKIHIHHGLFRERGESRPGEVLRRALERYPARRVIFSTRSREHLRENLEELG